MLRNFLQAREGRRLASEEFAEFRRLVAVVRLTLDQLDLLDQAMVSVTENAFTAEELIPPAA